MNLYKLLALFVIIPLMELALLIQVGKVIGTLPTISIILITGIIGASLARIQGLGLIIRFRNTVAQGELPTQELLDGICILAGALLLLTPGLITDTLGFLLLIPFTRKIVSEYLKRKLKEKIQAQEIHFQNWSDDF